MGVLRIITTEKIIIAFFYFKWVGGWRVGAILPIIISFMHFSMFVMSVEKYCFFVFGLVLMYH